MVKGSEIGDFGGGELEQLRPWLGSQWPGATLGVPSCQGATRRALVRRRSRAGALPRGHFDHVA